MRMPQRRRPAASIILMNQNNDSYDTVPYPSYTFPQTHPDRLSTIGLMFGTAAAHPERCRVLELGCGDGTNLLSFAYALPNATFVGIDLSAVHIARADAAAAGLGVTNAVFRQADVTALDGNELGTFDFVIAHGLFSWVPDGVREHILRIYAECLAPRGVGYISYNVYPGCHLREISSGIMKTHADAVEDPQAKVSQGIAFLNHVVEAAEAGSLYQTMLRWELEHMIDRSAQNVFHDDLSTFNRPFYFREFAAMIGNSGLKFFSEADPSASNPARLSVKAQEILGVCGDNVDLREQMIDLITCRRFRASLICKADLPIGSSIDEAPIRGFYLSSSIRADSGDADPKKDGSITFTGSNGTSVSIGHAPTKAALLHLGNIYARNISFDDLIRKSAAALGLEQLGDDQIGQTEAILRQFYGAGLVELHRYQPKFTSLVSDRPTASAFARWQIANGSEMVVSLANRNLTPESQATRMLITLLDNTRDKTALIEDLSALIAVPENERGKIGDFVDAELQSFAGAGLLIG